MEETTLIEYKKKLRQVMKAFIAFCDEHDLNYYVSGGTAIGVVRHQGIIPWDDDIDVYMLRPDYEKFLSLRDTLSKSKYEITDFTNGSYPLQVFAKFSDKTTTVWEYKDSPYITGVWVDVFPLDQASENFANEREIALDYKWTIDFYRRSCHKHSLKSLWQDLTQDSVKTFVSSLKDIFYYIPKHKEYHKHLLELQEKIKLFRGNYFYCYGIHLALPSKWHFDNYVYVFNEGKISLAFVNSVLITFAVSVIVLLSGSLCAFIISRKETRYTKFLYNIFLMGMICPIQIVTTFGLLKILHLTGTYTGVILIESAMIMPWTIFTLTGLIKNIPKELDEAAFIDGASPVKMFFIVIMPLLKPILATVLVTTAMGAWNEFMIPLYFFNTSSKWTMPLTVYNFFGQYASNWNYVFADLVLTALPITLLYLVCQKYIVAGATSGAVKG